MRWASVALTATLAFGPAIAEGQRARAEGARYRSLVRDAVAEFDAGRWAEARALFRQAHELEPSARTLRGIGMCSFELREYAAAIRELRAALAERRRPLPRAHRRQVERLLARAYDFVGRFRVTLAPADAVLRVDGVEPEPDDGELVLDLGRHVITAEREGHVPVERRIEVRGGEQGDLHIVLSPVPVAEALPSPLPPPAVHGADPAPVVALGSAGAALAGAVVATLWLADREHELSICAAAGEDCLNRGALAAQRDASIGVTVGLWLAAGALAATGVLVAVGSEQPGRETSFACAPGAPGISCRASF